MSGSTRACAGIDNTDGSTTSHCPVGAPFCVESGSSYDELWHSHGESQPADHEEDHLVLLEHPEDAEPLRALVVLEPAGRLELDRVRERRDARRVARVVAGRVWADLYGRVIVA